jgi:demethylmenaquinone methyltransferase/2-methoxy-6-polyprenyl-1,4-benzoquinol methylase
MLSDFPMIDHFGPFASIYDWFVRKPNLERLCELLRLPTAGRLLDAGGGTGRVSRHLKSMVGNLVVSDLSRPMLKQAFRCRGLNSVQTYVERLPFPNGCFDRVLVVDAWHHFRSQEEAAREFWRVLKPGGRLVIEEQDIERLPIKLVALGERLALMGSHFYTSKQIVDQVRSHGLDATVKRNGRLQFWIVADKRK